MAPIAVTLERREPPAGIVSLTGECDAYAALRLESELDFLLGSGMHVVVDLSETSFVDSHTLSTLLTARHRAEQHQLGFTLALPGSGKSQVDRILDMTGLRTMFAVYPSVERGLTGARAGKSTGDRARAA